MQSRKIYTSFFSREPEIFEVETTSNKCSVLFRKDFEQWTTDLLKSKRINATALAIFLFRNESFENEQSAEDLQKRLFSLFQFSEEEKSRWFSASSNIPISFSTTCYKWQDSFTIGNASYSFKSSHKSIVFKPSNDLYSVVASPEELTRGPFYQPLYASSDNALLFNSEKYFLKNSTNAPSTPLASDSPVQIIYYGVPGCGKSNKVNEELKRKNVPDERKIRTVFHPEYTNADFVGQILPKTDGGNISYEFTPGPFTQILKRACQKPNKDFYLIIEEINRGNAAAIFGDIFQLLDRDENGESQYSIQNKDIAQYINSQDNSIRLPKNLSIIATMNTSDQNVFTLDNAFQRRFDMVLVRSGVTRNTGVNEPSLDPNKYVFDNPAIRDQFKAEIEGSKVPWGFFWDWVNSKIECALRGLSSTEDKRLGLWFVKNKNGKIPKKVFAEKVLKYLWDDAFKFKRKEIFSDNIHSLEELISEFEEPKNANALSRIFKDFPENGQS